MDFFDVVKNIGSLLTLILSGVSFAGIMTKFQNKRYKELFDEYVEKGVDFAAKYTYDNAVKVLKEAWPEVLA